MGFFSTIVRSAETIARGVELTAKAIESTTNAMANGAEQIRIASEASLEATKRKSAFRIKLMKPIITMKSNLSLAKALTKFQSVLDRSNDIDREAIKVFYDSDITDDRDSYLIQDYYDDTISSFKNKEYLPYFENFSLLQKSIYVPKIQQMEIHQEIARLLRSELNARKELLKHLPEATAQGFDLQELFHEVNLSWLYNKKP